MIYPQVINPQGSPLILSDQNDPKNIYRPHGIGNSLTSSTFQNYQGVLPRDADLSGGYKPASINKNPPNLPEDSLQNKYDGNIYDFSKFGGDFKKKPVTQANPTNFVPDLSQATSGPKWPSDPQPSSRLERPSHDDRFHQPKASYDNRQPEPAHNVIYTHREPKLSYTLQSGKYSPPSPLTDLSQSVPSYPPSGLSLQPPLSKPQPQQPPYSFYPQAAPNYGDRPLASSQIDSRQGTAPMYSERSRPKEESIYSQNTTQANNYGRIAPINY